MSEQYEYELRDDFWRHIQILRQLGSGAKLFNSHNTVTVMHGRKVIWWWRPEKEHQEIRKDTQRLAELFGRISKQPQEFAIEKMSPGRLIRAFITHVLKLPKTKETDRYGDRYYYLVKTRPQLWEEGNSEQIKQQDELCGFNYELLGDASHWHYLYLAPSAQGYAIELDIKSAYFTAYLKQPTLLLNDPGLRDGRPQGKPYFIGDGGAMARLREINSSLPKWFRLQLLGIMGSHQQEFFQIEPETGLLQRKIFGGGIKYGMAFNAVHKAIYSVYETMAEVAAIVKEDLLRSHTDSFCLKATMTRRAEAEMLSALAERGFSVACKGIGWAHFWDIDTGVLGFGKPKGHFDEVDELRQRDGVYIKPTPRKMYERWQHWLPSIPEWMIQSGERIEVVPVKEMPKESPQKLGGYWRLRLNDKWYRDKPDDFEKIYTKSLNFGNS